MKAWIGVLTVSLVGAPAAAQDPAMPMQQEAMQRCIAMMGGPPPQMLLHLQDSLALSADQVSRLEALHDQAQERAMPHMEPAMKAHMEAAAVLEADAPDFAAYEAKLREAADHMILAHTEMARASVAARQALSAEQRSRLEALMPAMMQMMHGGDRPMGAAAGAHQMGAGPGHEMGAGAMMMHCMMMGAGAQQHAPIR
ncbi:MAG TPA: periplasmic heavy metal sensor [Longimicrobiales bacterium]|nr:periplasmic heavy metal sensor [Longimicrobiales bacterium]